MNICNVQMPNCYTAVIGGAYRPVRSRSVKIPPTIVNIEEPPRIYHPFTERHRREQLIGPNFNFIDTTISVARPFGTVKKYEE